MNFLTIYELIAVHSSDLIDPMTVHYSTTDKRSMFFTTKMLETQMRLPYSNPFVVRKCKLYYDDNRDASKIEIDKQCGVFDVNLHEFLENSEREAKRLDFELSLSREAQNEMEQRDWQWKYIMSPHLNLKYSDTEWQKPVLQEFYSDLYLKETDGNE